MLLGIMVSNYLSNTLGPCGCRALPPWFQRQVPPNYNCYHQHCTPRILYSWASLNTNIMTFLSTTRFLIVLPSRLHLSFTWHSIPLYNLTSHSRIKTVPNIFHLSSWPVTICWPPNVGHSWWLKPAMNSSTTFWCPFSSAQTMECTWSQKSNMA